MDDDGEAAATEQQSISQALLSPSTSSTNNLLLNQEVNHDYGTSATANDGHEDKLAVYQAGGEELDNEEEVSVDAVLHSTEEERRVPLWNMAAILSTAFGYGCIMTTLFLITLPTECERISTNSNGSVPKSVALGVFVAIAGVTQLVSPLVGRLSDTYEPPRVAVDARTNKNNKHSNPKEQQEQNANNRSVRWAEIGQRMPYHIVGGILSVLGLLGQMFSSDANLWIRYGFAFFFSMVGLNIQYAIMIAFIPDQIPQTQTGIANGVLAFLIVTGSLFGFGLFHTILSETVSSMYGLYLCIVVFSSILTGTHAHERDAELTAERMQFKYSKLHENHNDEVLPGSTEVMDVAVLLDDDSSHHTENNSVVMGTPTTTRAAQARRRQQKHRWPRRARRAARKAVKRAHQILVVPTALLVQSVATDPVRKLSCKSVRRCYTIDRGQHHDFFIVTVSRLCYYCGLSVQTFFLYFVHDIIGVKNNPEAAVATLAILGQCSGALTCYPVGVVSDYVLGGRRTPFVYAACFVLGTATLTLIMATTLEQMRLFCLILGAANGVYLTMETSMAVDTLPIDLIDDDDVGNAQLLGVWGVAAFLGSALGPMIGGPLLYIFGSGSSTNTGSDETTILDDENKEVVEEYTLTGYAVVLSLSALYFYASAFTLQFLKDHHE